VYYDPENPQTVCLERKAEGVLFVYGIAVVFCLVGILMVAGLIFARD
jgi:hypothetical protein